MRFLWVLMAMFICSSVLAGADVELEVSLVGGSFVLPGELASVEIKWTNHGPDPADNVYAGSFHFVGAGQSTIHIFPNAQTPPCRFSRFAFDGPPNSPNAISTTVFSDPTTLQPDEVAVCFVDLVTYPDSPPVINQTFSAWRPVDDPDESNNTSVLQILTGNASVPVPSGQTATWLVLTFGLLFMGFRRISASNLRSSGSKSL